MAITPNDLLRTADFLRGDVNTALRASISIFDIVQAV